MKIRRLFVVGFSIMFILWLVTSAHALRLSTYEWATWCYDFSTDPIAPPYVGMFSEITITPVGSAHVTRGLTGPDPRRLGYASMGVGTLTSRSQFYFDSDDELQYLSVYVKRGEVEVDSYVMAMISQVHMVNEDDGVRFYYTTTDYMDGRLIGVKTYVPEPTTMLLLGARLVGLAGFGRKKFKK
jgi:hypothetical protein